MSDTEVLAKQTKEIYHIEDKRSGYVVATFLAASVAEAERNFQNELKNEDSALAKYPDDFALVHDGYISHTTLIKDKQVVTSTVVMDISELEEE